MADPIITPVTHAFDETGVLPENYIENEQRVLPVRNVRAVSARFGAFFTDGFRMRDANGIVVPATKYRFALYKNVISAKVGKDVCAAVIITDATVVAPVYIDYHCVGGPWGASNEHILEMFNQLQTDDRPVTWGNILGKPDEYKPAHHFQDIGDLYGAEYWVEAIERLADAFLMGDSASHDEIWRRMDEIRQEMLTAIGDQNTSLRAYIDQKDAQLQTNINTVDSRVTTVRQELINADTVINTRVTNVRQELINADAVVNDRVTTVRQELLDGIAVVNNRVTTVQNSLQGQIDATNNALASHTSNTNNPHQTNAAQVGAYTTQQVDSMIAAINNNLAGNYVKKNAPGEDMSLHINSGNLYAWVNGAWRHVWPAQWS